MCAVTFVDLSCPGCGAAVSTRDQSCPYCTRPVVITSFTSLRSMGTVETRKYLDTYRSALTGDPANPVLNGSVAMCYMSLGLYDQAICAFEKAIQEDFDNPETYFYCAVCQLKGRKAFLTPLSGIRKAEEYLQAALSIEPRGTFYFLFAYLRYDFYARKSLNAYPDFNEYLELALQSGVSDTDIQFMKELLGVDIEFPVGR